MPVITLDVSEDKQSILVKIPVELASILVPRNGSRTQAMPLLTPAEIRIFNQLRKGARNKHIASILNLCVRTVKYHASNIYRKCGVSNRQELMLKWHGRIHGA